MSLFLAVAMALQAAPPAPPARDSHLVSKNDPEYASVKAFHEFVDAMMRADPDARLMAATQEVQRIRDSLPEISHRVPFDARALSHAYRDLALAKGRMEARQNEMVVERLAALPPDQRVLVIERIPHLGRPMIATVPPAQPKKN